MVIFVLKEYTLTVLRSLVGWMKGLRILNIQ